MSKSYTFKYPRVAHVGHTVSHAKNRNSRSFKYNLHTVTILVDGIKKRMKVPTKVLRQLKNSGVTTHWKKADSK
jgi:ribosomal protein L28